MFRGNDVFSWIYQSGSDRTITHHPRSTIWWCLYTYTPTPATFHRDMGNLLFHIIKFWHTDIFCDHTKKKTKQHYLFISLRPIYTSWLGEDSAGYCYWAQWWHCDQYVYSRKGFKMHGAVQKKESVLLPLQIVSFVIYQLEAPWTQATQHGYWQSNLSTRSLPSIVINSQ